jgi:hypothetical protein
VVDDLEHVKNVDLGFDCWISHVLSEAVMAARVGMCLEQMSTLW